MDCCPLGSSRQEYWSELPDSPPGDFPDPAIKSMSPMSPAFVGDHSLPLSHLRSPYLLQCHINIPLCFLIDTLDFFHSYAYELSFVSVIEWHKIVVKFYFFFLPL